MLDTTKVVSPATLTKLENSLISLISDDGSNFFTMVSHMVKIIAPICSSRHLRKQKTSLIYQPYAVVKTYLHQGDHRGRDRIVVGFTTTYAISAYHH